MPPVPFVLRSTQDDPDFVPKSSSNKISPAGAVGGEPNDRGAPAGIVSGKALDANTTLHSNGSSLEGAVAGEPNDRGAPSGTVASEALDANTTFPSNRISPNVAARGEPNDRGAPSSTVVSEALDANTTFSSHRISVEVAARGEPSEPRAAGGKAVLVIPGLNGHPGLLMRYAPVLFPNMRAIAFSHHLDEADEGVEGLATRALGLLDEQTQPTDRVYVCGESFGGTVALTMAHLAPERVQGLILFSTFGWHPSMLARRGAGALALWSFLGQRMNDHAYRAGRLASVPTQLGLRFSNELLLNYIWRPRAVMAAYRTKAELSLRFDARPWLHTLACPTFILTGTWDPVVPAAAGRQLAGRIPKASLHRVGGGHLVHLVQAQRVGDLISDWARDLE